MLDFVRLVDVKLADVMPLELDEIKAGRLVACAINACTTLGINYNGWKTRVLSMGAVFAYNTCSTELTPEKDIQRKLDLLNFPWDPMTNHHRQVESIDVDEISWLEHIFSACLLCRVHDEKALELAAETMNAALQGELTLENEVPLFKHPYARDLAQAIMVMFQESAKRCAKNAKERNES